MNIVIAPDSFKESMTAVEAAGCIRKGIQAVLPDAGVVLIPMADGGEGTVASVLSRTGGTMKKVWVHDPLMRRIPASFGILPGKKTALIEMAAGTGLECLKPEERNPLLTSSFGTGELIKAALDSGCTRIIVGLGGSATNDGGAGMMQALGVRFFDSKGKSLPPVTGDLLGRICKIDLTKADRRIRHTEFVAATDVNSPLLGPHGATRTFAPQKGAGPQAVETLEKNMTGFAGLLEKTFAKDIKDFPGGGAAGGLGAAMTALLNARIQPGFEIVAGLTRLEEELKTAGLVITGEGKLDAQTKHGKTPWGVAVMAKKYHIPVVAFAGLVGEGVEKLYRNEFKAIIQISKPGMQPAEAIRQGKILLEEAVKRYFHF